MAFIKGNQFWQNRTRHGREKIFASPELLWAAAEEFFEWCDNNPWQANEVIKSGDRAGEVISVPIQRPYTLGALCIYLGVSSSYFRSYKSLNKDKEESKEFMAMIQLIEDICYTQKFEGATVGVFNATIIARDLGLKDQTEIDHTTKGEKISGFNYLAPDKDKVNESDNSTKQEAA